MKFKLECAWCGHKETRDIPEDCPKMSASIQLCQLCGLPSVTVGEDNWQKITPDMFDALPVTVRAVLVGLMADLAKSDKTPDVPLHEAMERSAKAHKILEQLEQGKSIPFNVKLKPEQKFGEN